MVGRKDNNDSKLVGLGGNLARLSLRQRGSSSFISSIIICMSHVTSGKFRVSLYILMHFMNFIGENHVEYMLMVLLACFLDREHKTEGERVWLALI